jgi:flagellar biogenesis protein FliO
MATIVNNPDSAQSGNNMSNLFAVILLIIAAILFFIYGLPYLSGYFGGGTGGGTQVTLPSEVNVQTK